MNIKKKLLITNMVIFMVMVALAMAYTAFASALRSKFQITSTSADEIRDVSTTLVDTTLTENEKKISIRQKGFRMSVYDGEGKCIWSDGYTLKGYTFSNSKTEPAIVVFSDKMVLESKQGNKFYVAVKADSRAKDYEVYNVIAIVIMIVVSGIVVCLACYNQFRMIFPQLKILRGGLKQITAGDFSHPLRGIKRDEIGVVIGEFEIMRRKLAELNEQKSQFDRQRGEIIAGISHDLKTPLTTIQGYTKGLIDGVAKTPEKTQRYLNIIYETTGTMNSLVNQLNEFAKMDIDTIEYSFMEKDMVKLLSEFATTNVPIYATKGLKVVTDFPNEEVLAEVDKEQFLRVVRNILDNSVKYKDKKEGHAELKLYEEKGYAVIEISDDGPGVSEHELKYIFESYYRGDPSRTNPTTGSGLGLSIVKTIVEAHGGSVRAESELGLKIIIKLPQRRKRNEKNLDR